MNYIETDLLNDYTVLDPGGSARGARPRKF